MYKLLALAFAGLLLISSCNTKESSTTLTANQQKGISDILAFYNGQCDYGKTVTGSTDTTFWIRESESPAANKLQKTPELPASNIAYLFYKNLGNEKSKFGQVMVQLIFNDADSAKFNFTPAQLEVASQKIELVRKIVGVIKDQDFTQLKTYFVSDSSIAKVDPGNIIANLRDAESSFGTIIEFVPYGFRFSEVGGKQVMHVSGLISRDRKSNFFSVDLDADPSKNAIYAMNYQL